MCETSVRQRLNAAQMLFLLLDKRLFLGVIVYELMMEKICDIDIAN